MKIFLIVMLFVICSGCNESSYESGFTKGYLGTKAYLDKKKHPSANERGWLDGLNKAISEEHVND